MRSYNAVGNPLRKLKAVSSPSSSDRCAKDLFLLQFPSFLREQAFSKLSALKLFFSSGSSSTSPIFWYEALPLLERMRFFFHCLRVAAGLLSAANRAISPGEYVPMNSLALSPAVGPSLTKGKVSPRATGPPRPVFREIGPLRPSHRNNLGSCFKARFASNI